MGAPAASAGAAARWATRTQFFCSGFIFATWGVHIPTVKVRYDANEAELGLAMLAAGVGALVGLTQASRWIGRFGARRNTAATGIVYALLLAGLTAMPGYSALLVLLLGFGIVTSVFDVAINTDAAQLEAQCARPLMSGMHGMFSLGGMAGAATGSAALASGMSPDLHLLCVALANASAIGCAASFMLPGHLTRSQNTESAFRLPRGVLLMLGALAALGLIAEGAVYDWSVLYLHLELGSPQQQAALAYASFSAAMAAARFAGDALRARLAPQVLLRASAWLAAGSMTLVLLTPVPWIALAGFAGAGVGFANIVPVLFAAAARVPGVAPARGIASVASVAYLGFMVGPPVIGLLAEASSLTAALYVVVGFAVALALSAGRAGSAAR